MFNSKKELLEKCNFLFFFNANTLFIDYVGEEVLPGPDNSGLVAATSNPFVFARNKREWTYDRNPESLAFVPYDKGDFYFRGSFNGGTSQAYLKMSDTLDRRIQKDLEKNVIALWHDESHLNRYFMDASPPPLVLDPGYAYGEQWPGQQKLIKPLIVMRDKAKMFGSLEVLRGIEVREKSSNKLINYYRRLQQFFRNG